MNTIMNRPKFIRTNDKNHSLKPMKPKQKPAWNDTVTDQTVYKSTPRELRNRKEAHRSKFSEIVKEELQEKGILDLENTVDSRYFSAISTKIPERRRSVPNRMPTLHNRSSFDGVKSVSSRRYSERLVLQPSNLNDFQESDILLPNEDPNTPVIENSKDDCFDSMQNILKDLRSKINIENELENEENYQVESQSYSGFTIQLLETLNHLNNQFLQFNKHLKEEKDNREELESKLGNQNALLAKLQKSLDSEQKLRKVLEEEVHSQKVIIDCLTSEVIQVQRMLALCLGDKMNRTANKSNCDRQSECQQNILELSSKCTTDANLLPVVSTPRCNSAKQDSRSSANYLHCATSEKTLDSLTTPLTSDKLEPAQQFSFPCAIPLARPLRSNQADSSP